MRIKFYLVVSFFSVLICGCKDDEVKRPYPRVITGEVVNITEEGAIFKGTITSFDENEISTVGFVWSQNSDPRIDNSDVIYLSSDEIDQNSFSFSLKTTLIANEFYRVRAFATQGELRVYGDTTSFISLGSSSIPIISDFSPKSGTDSTEITILGEGFSHKNDENTVSFGDIEAKVISSSVEELKVLVPAGIDSRESTLKVTVTGNEFIAEEKFVRLAPQINGISSMSSGCGTSITISGENFSTIIGGNKVYFGDVLATITSYDAIEINAIVPNGLTPDPLKISIEVAGQVSVAPSDFNPASPSIQSFSPISGTDGDPISISGSNFGSSPEGIEVYFGTVKANIVSVNSTEVIVEVPSGIQTSEVDLIVEVGCAAPFTTDVKFRRLAPIITDFDPKNVTCQETILITGDNFGITTESNKVFFDDSEGIVLSASSSELEVRPPAVLVGTFDLSVETAGQRVNASNSIELDVDLTCDESLVAYYPFNGNANDESDNSNNGTVNGASLAMDRNGNENSAYSFDGVNDYITLGSDFDFENATINIWFKVLDYNTDSDHIFGSDHSSKQNGLLALASKEIDGVLNLRYNKNGSIVDAPTNEEWHMATISFVGNDYNFFLDGVEVGSGTDNGDINSVNGISVSTIGCDRNIGRHFTGLIDDIRIYDRALTITEIDALYNELE